MQTTLRFICCSAYNFTDDDGKKVEGITCKCFDEKSKKIVKVKTNKVVLYDFGDDVLVDVVPNGNYINYEIVDDE